MKDTASRSKRGEVSAHARSSTPPHTSSAVTSVRPSAFTTAGPCERTAPFTASLRWAAS